MSEPAVFLIDVSGILHRALHVAYRDHVADVHPSDDRFLRVACQQLANLMYSCAVTHMALMVDSTEPSIRCDEYPSYKAMRAPHHPVFREQVPRFYGMMRDISVSVVEAPRYEADDLIASVVRGPGRFTIASLDKDLLALLDDENRRVTYLDFGKGWVTTKDVRDKFGVEPSQLYDYIGLVGDSADGIPGVPGVGQKTASRLLRKFDSLDEIYSDDRRQDLATILSEKQIAKLLAAQSDAFLSRRLAIPRLNGAVTGWSQDAFKAPPWEAVRRACG